MLKQLQAQFQEALLDPSQDPAGLFADRAHFEAYQHTVEGSLIKALRVIYPVVCELLGDECFWGLARQYAKANPSQDYTLYNYGVTFPEFIEHFEPAKVLPYLADVARFDYGFHQIFANPTGFLIASPFPLLDIWSMHQAEGSHHRHALDLDSLPGGCWCLWREGIDRRIEPVTAAQWNRLAPTQGRTEDQQQWVTFSPTGKESSILK